MKTFITTATAVVILGGTSFSALADGAVTDPMSSSAKDITYQVSSTGVVTPGRMMFDDTFVYNGSPETANGTQESGTGIYISISKASAAHTYKFAYDLPSDVTMVSADDGSVVFEKESDSTVIGGLDAPWAKDANGNPVPTHYDINGHTITQTIDFTANTAFPIIADPWWNPLSWNWRKVGKVAVSSLKKCGIGALGGTLGLTGSTITINLIKRGAGTAMIRAAGGPYAYVSAAAVGCVGKLF